MRKHKYIYMSSLARENILSCKRAHACLLLQETNCFYLLQKNEDMSSLVREELSPLASDGMSSLARDNDTTTLARELL